MGFAQKVFWAQRCGFAARDVRQGFALPSILAIKFGLRPRSGLCPNNSGPQARTRGIAPNIFSRLPAGHSPASHHGGEAVACNDK